ncbi:spore germination protein [Peribacillus frigoritolerans]|uniref:spore germination protein n=1 Tax=Peribacillus TaxID=2675229 RepID=UPI002E1A53BB|nr:spore germination protein [Peribacillus frigoritolerans]MED3998122.1 spore germination protein [Peribacillus frigoritolerans]
MRVLRYLSFFLALLTPSLYVAVSTFHQEMLPTPFLISLHNQYIWLASGNNDPRYQCRGSLLWENMHFCTNIKRVYISAAPNF